MGVTNPTTYTETPDYLDTRGIRSPSRLVKISTAKNDPLIVVQVDTDNRVFYIVFEHLFVAHLFNDAVITDNAGRLDPNETAREVIESYNIPAMDPLPSGQGYSYKSPDEGFEVRITLGYVVSLRKITKQVERHFER
jgi:hypothetical protein